MAPLVAAVVPLLALASSVSAHGFITSIDAGGTSYPGADPNNPNDESPGWQAQNTDNGFVAPSDFSTAAIACHKEAVAPSVAASVAAGDVMRLTWNTWPDSHHGPVLDYLAPCSDCSSADAESLSFVKLDEAGLVSGSNPGTWATDELMDDSFSWDVTIPSDLAEGTYVLRHEIIALHSAAQEDGAQSYPQCINIEVTGGGSATPDDGEPATSFYTPSDPGIQFNLYEDFDSYPIPGPEVWAP